jgi:hypothetical protein
LALAALASLLVTAGLAALSVAIVVSITGGFVIDAGPFHLSAHRLGQPLIAALLAFALGAAVSRHRVRGALAFLDQRLEAHALAIVVVLAATTAGIGISYGTYAASGADAGGYLSEARLLGQRQLAFDEPLVRRVPWPDAAWTFAPLGFRPGTRQGEIVPTYPPGLPFAMLLASLAVGEAGPFLVAPLLGAVCVIATYLLATRTHSRRAGIVAASLMSTSPVWLFQIVQPMSDVPATALWALALLAAVSGRAVYAGVASSVALTMRPNLFPLAAAVAWIIASWPDRTRALLSLRRLRVVTIYAIAASTGLVVLAFVQWRLYGSPLASGHGTVAELFDIANIAPNIRDYTVRIARGETAALIALAGATVILLATHRQSAASLSIATPLRLFVATALTVLVCYLPYGVFPDWSYLRFLLPAFPAAFIVVGAVSVTAADRLPLVLRGPMLVLGLVALCSLNIVIARRESAFDLWRYESRYRTAGRYLDAVLPQHAVIVTAQESASALYYTRRPVLRWDLLRADLDAAVDTLRRLGRHPVLLVEDWEEPAIRARFPSSALARLDWRSRARFGTTTRVRYLDPNDREDAGGASSNTQDDLP